MKQLVLIALLALAACGGGGDDTDGDSSHDIPTPKVSCRVDGSCL